eukprot:134894-Chlamydomonas_euryale.AAC.1
MPAHPRPAPPPARNVAVQTRTAHGRAWGARPDCVPVGVGVRTASRLFACMLARTRLLTQAGGRPAGCIRLGDVHDSTFKPSPSHSLSLSSAGGLSMSCDALAPKGFYNAGQLSPR